MREKLNFERRKERKEETEKKEERELSEEDREKINYIKKYTYLGRVVERLLEKGEISSEEIKEMKAGRASRYIPLLRGKRLYGIFEESNGRLSLKVRGKELNQRLLEYWGMDERLDLEREILRIVEEEKRIPFLEIIKRSSFRSSFTRQTFLRRVKALQEAGLIQSSMQGRRRILIKKEFKGRKE